MINTKKIYRWMKNNILLTVAVLALLLITLGSRNSFLYPANYECDINIYKTIGRGMLEGFVPYRDLYDHKGPYVYLLFMILELWEPSVYLLEIVVCTISLYYAYKIMQLYNENNLGILIVFGLTVYFNISFHSGGAVEEYFFPMELYITYLGLKYIKEDISISRKQFFLIGIYGGLMLWSKFTVLGFFVGWCIVPFVLMIKQRKYKELTQGISLIILGVIAITIPAGIYLGINNAIPDFIQTYFIDNIRYASEDIFIANLIAGCASTLLVKYTFVIGVSWILGIIYLIKQGKAEKYFGLTILMFMLVSTYSGGRCFSYSSFPLFIFLIFALLLLRKFKVIKILIVISIVVSMFITPNFSSMKLDKENSPQVIFAEIMKTSTDEPTLLVYNSMDAEFFIEAGILPNCKYFFKCNIEELGKEERAQYLKNKEVDFYICVDEPVEFEGYKLISEMNYGYTVKLNYYLYQLDATN